MSDEFQNVKRGQAGAADRHNGGTHIQSAKREQSKEVRHGSVIPAVSATIRLFNPFVNLRQLRDIPVRILVIEDEAKVASFVRRGLEAEGYRVDIAPDGEVGLTQAFDHEYDLVILDGMLPKRDGLSVLQEMRRHKLRVPVLMLTARDTVADKVAGLDRGADDYLTKPFAFEELLARIRALLRRGSPLSPSTLSVADLELDLISARGQPRGNSN